jgi:5-methyltetrahydrofolate--homocysteine methyltransferase
MLIVGERINTSRKAIRKAVAERDKDTILAEANNQVDAGADFIDVNAGASDAGRESEDLSWLIDVVQESLPQVPICIDSSIPASLASVINRVHQDPLINSITGEQSVFEAVSHIIQGRECHIVALCIDDKGIPKTADQVIENAARLITDIERLGVKRDRIYVDPVIQAVCTNTKAALIALEAMAAIKREFEGVHVICGLSNVSFGLPRRHLINRTFLSLAMKAGLDAAIIDPLDRALMGALRAAAVLLDQDPWCQDYTRAFREGSLDAK